MEQSINLRFIGGGSDKVYQAQLVEVDGGYNVAFQYGRYGSTLVSSVKNPKPLDYASALKVYNKLINEKQGKGYKPTDGSVSYVAADVEERQTGIHPQLLNPIDETELENFLTGNKYCAQEKFDGKRMLLKVENNEASAINRKGLICGAPQSFLTEAIELSNGQDLILDGEAVGETFYAFDVLKMGNKDITSLPYKARRILLLECLHTHIQVVYTASNEAEKRQLLEDTKINCREGIVFKDENAPYQAGRPNSGGTQLKFKLQEEATCRVSGIHPAKRSFSIEVADGKGGYISVGNVTIPANKDLPAINDLVEVRYLYTGRGGSLYQPFFKEVRSDKTEPDTYDSLKFKAL